MEVNYFDIFSYLPKEIIVWNKGKYLLNSKIEDKYIFLSYVTKHSNNSFQEHSYTLPRFVIKDNETFEVLGLLQAEMGKTQNGCLTFANTEPKIINKVIKWFEKNLEISKEHWKWYIAINIKDPYDQNYKKMLEEKLINYWLNKTRLKLEQGHPKKVTYRNVKHTQLKEDYYGCLMIEFKNNLFSQIFKNFLKLVVTNLFNENAEYIKHFMKGILAGEGTVAYHPKSKHYAVHISASKLEEREIYKKCLFKLGIELKIYSNYKETLISKKHNLIQLLKQKLMILHPRKYSKFLYMMRQYPGITEEIGYFNERREPWNKIPKEKIDEIIKLYNSKKLKNKEIAERLGISYIKVQRVLKENNLGKRVKKIDENIRKEIAKFVEDNPALNYDKIAKHFKISNSAVGRAYRKYH